MLGVVSIITRFNIATLMRYQLTLKSTHVITPHFANERRAALVVQRFVQFAQLCVLDCSFVTLGDHQSLKSVRTE